MRKLFLFFFVVLMSGWSMAQQTKSSPFAFRGFCGGMMVHSGYVQSADFAVKKGNNTPEKHQIKGMPFGLGGCLRFRFGNHFRLGTEGYVSRLNYDKGQGSSQVGWGGITLDAVFDMPKTHFFLGFTVGGGIVKNQLLLQGDTQDFTIEQQSMFRKYGFVAISPYLGAEFSLTQQIGLVVKADCLLNVSRQEADFPLGVRLYLGVMFSRAYKKKIKTE